MSKSTLRYRDLEEFCSVNAHLKERWVAESIGIDPVRFSKLKVPGKYPIKPNNEETESLAALLNQSSNYVRGLYEAAA